MQEEKPKKMELLAPVGTVAAFQAAVDEGADAVYIGAPSFSARTPVRELTWSEIDAMISHAHQYDLKAYIAMNSLLKDDEIPAAVQSLAIISAMRADGLIIQDLGLYRLVRKYFPELRIHASTLLAAHNSIGVKQYADMGFSRVVLARELTIREISQINRQCGVDLEVFVHGALCFSYSGLCLFSSSLGGRSGLRGRCVQPCRRRYSWMTSGRGAGKGAGAKQGYLFSMKDLCGIDLLPDLQRAGVKSVKIEGRLKSAQYVASVVKAYRLALDADIEDLDALRKAREVAGSAMSRKTCDGYFLMPQPKDLISPDYSGNIGIFLGRAAAVKTDLKVGAGQKKSQLTKIFLKDGLEAGDRLRVHHEKTGERNPFTLSSMQVSGRPVSAASAGSSVEILVPFPVMAGDSFYKVDTSLRRQLEAGKTVGKLKAGRSMKALLDHGRVDSLLHRLGRKNAKVLNVTAGKVPNRSARAKGVIRPEWWLRVSDLKSLKHRFTTAPKQVIITLCQASHNDFRRNKKYLQPFLKKIVWALPPVIFEKDIRFYEKAVTELTRGGFRTWQISHLSQLQFFTKSRRSVEICGDYTLNVLNSQAISFLRESGLRSIQLSVENDRRNLQMICSGSGGPGAGLSLGMTVFGMLPLFTARLSAGHFKFGRPFLSPKDEKYSLVNTWGLTMALPEKPFSLLPFMPELEAMGMDYAVVDLSNMKTRMDFIDELDRQLNGRARKGTYSSFNYQGVLQ